LLSRAKPTKPQNSTSQQASGHACYEYEYSVHYKFDGDFSPIEQWLAQNCTGEYEYKLDSAARGPGDMLDIVLMFEQKEDRSRFKDMILSGALPSSH